MLTLVIGNKNLSSWSLRPWLVLKHFGLAFHEIKLPLDTPEFHRDIVKYSAAKRVPILIDGDLRSGTRSPSPNISTRRCKAGPGPPTQRSAPTRER